MRRRLQDAGIHVVLIPERAPNANAYAERFVRSIKEECLDRLIPIGERHFRRAVTEYVEHYHRRTESPGTRQSPDLGPAGHPGDESRAAPSRGSADCSISMSERRDLQAAEKWNITGRRL